MRAQWREVLCVEQQDAVGPCLMSQTIDEGMGDRRQEGHGLCRARWPATVRESWGFFTSQPLPQVHRPPSSPTTAVCSLPQEAMPNRFTKKKCQNETAGTCAARVEVKLKAGMPCRLRRGRPAHLRLGRLHDTATGHGTKRPASYGGRGGGSKDGRASRRRIIQNRY
jgi:hypothetical protein